MCEIALLAYWGHEFDLSRHRSRGHLIPRMPFPVGSPLEASLYLKLLSTFNNVCIFLIFYILTEMGGGERSVHENAVSLPSYYFDH